MTTDQWHHITQRHVDSTSLFGGQYLPDRDEEQYICSWNAALL